MLIRINRIQGFTGLRQSTEVELGTIARHQLKFIVDEPITEEVIQWIN